MEWSSEGTILNPKPKTQICFNPCSDGMIFWGGCSTCSTITSKTCFNPCSDGMIFWGMETISLGTAFNDGVSILVLMEWSSEVRLWRRISRSMSCFNPCSDGMIFWGNLSTRDLMDEYRFQSLFWWNDLLRLKHSAEAENVPDVSILVLMEWSSEVKNRSHTHTLRRFQSLFWWNDLLRDSATGPLWMNAM